MTEQSESQGNFQALQRQSYFMVRPSEKLLLDLVDVAQLCSLEIGTIKKLASTHPLPCVVLLNRWRRYHPSDVKAWVQKISKANRVEDDLADRDARKQARGGAR